MKKYQYQVVRYIHDRITGEFVNVGLVFYAPSEGMLKAEFITRYARISQFFPEFNGSYLLQVLKTIKNNIVKLEDDIEGFKNTSSLSDITRKIYPLDDNALHFSEVQFGIDVDLHNTFDLLYEDIINKYQKAQTDTRVTDQQAWRKVYKQYFEKYKLVDKLVSHTIETSHDKIEFDKSWKNGSWHCYQTLSFDLKSVDAVKDKVYKWAGKLGELQSTNENLNLYFLTTSPKKNDLELNKFIEDKLKTESKHLKVKLIKEEEAEQFASTVKKEMEESQK